MKWKLGWFRNTAALGISSVSRSAVHSEAVPLVLFSVCSRFSSLIFSFVCVRWAPPVFGVSIRLRAAFVIR